MSARFPLVALGTIALDDIQTPFGSVKGALGGALIGSIVPSIHDEYRGRRFFLIVVVTGDFNETFFNVPSSPTIIKLVEESFCEISTPLTPQVLNAS